MPSLGELLGQLDSKGRAVKRNLSDLVNDPVGRLTSAGEELAQYFQDPMNFALRGSVGNAAKQIPLGLTGAGSRSAGGGGSMGGQATIGSRMRDIGLLSSDEFEQLMKLGRETNTELSPELLKAMENEAVRRRMASDSMPAPQQMQMGY